jgi:hypothetical protein
VLVAVLAHETPALAVPTELITNGDFTSSGVAWTDAFVPGASGSWQIRTVGSTLPRSGLPTSGAGGGMGSYAVFEGGSTQALYQTFHVPPDIERAILSFDMFVNDWTSSPVFNPEHHSRVDIITANYATLDVGAAVLFNAYLGTDGGPLPNDFTHYEFDITPVVASGGDYRIRFYTRSTITSFQLHQGVDNVSVMYVPEPGAGWLALVSAAAGAAYVVQRSRVRRCRAC